METWLAAREAGRSPRARRVGGGVAGVGLGVGWARAGTQGGARDGVDKGAAVAARP